LLRSIYNFVDSFLLSHGNRGKLFQYAKIIVNHKRHRPIDAFC